jgi:hypothetical protein
VSGAGRSFVAFACGRTRSGKSHLLAQLGAKFPRRLILDFVGEFTGKIPGARETFTLVDTVDALRRARRKGPRWIVTASIDPPDVPELLAAIAPTGAATDYGFSRAVGGMVLECGEIDMIAPNPGKLPAEVRNIYARSRHHSLSILAAARRPGEVHRIVTAWVDLLCAFQQDEPRDADYLARRMGAEAPDLIRALGERSYLRYFPNYHRLETVNEDGKVVQVHTGAAV